MAQLQTLQGQGQIASTTAIVDAIAAARNGEGGGPPGGGDGDSEAAEAVRDLQDVLTAPNVSDGPDGGPHPATGTVIENASASALLGGLESGGFNLSRGCPALSWPQSYDLGFGVVDLQGMSAMVCFAISILGLMIALGGFIQAGYIVAQVGR